MWWEWRTLPEVKNFSRAKQDRLYFYAEKASWKHWDVWCIMGVGLFLLFAITGVSIYLGIDSPFISVLYPLVGLPTIFLFSYARMRHIKMYLKDADNYSTT